MSTWHVKSRIVLHLHMAVCQNLVPLVNIKIAGKWMFIPLKMVLIGIDPYPSNVGLVNFWNWNLVFWIRWVHFGSRSMVYFAGKSWEIYNLVFEEKTFFGWVSRIGHVPCKPSVPFLMFFVLEFRVYSISGREKWSRLIIQPLIGIFGASMPLSSK